MPRNKIFGDFDPYEMMIAMDVKLGQIVEAHNNLARQYDQHKKDFDVLLHSHQVNQQSIVQLTQNNQEIFKALTHCLQELERIKQP